MTTQRLVQATHFRASRLLFAVCSMSALLGCGATTPSEPSTPNEPDRPAELPSPGARASGTSNSDGEAALTLGAGRLPVRVVDAIGKKLGNIKLGAVVGDSVMVVVAADPNGQYAPALRVIPRPLSAGTASLAVQRDNEMPA